MEPLGTGAIRTLTVSVMFLANFKESVSLAKQHWEDILKKNIDF